MKITYSNYIGSYIKPVIVITARHWFFVTCSKTGKGTSKVMKAGTDYDCFKWKEVDK